MPIFIFGFLWNAVVLDNAKIRCYSVQLEFRLEDFEFKARNETFVAGLGWGLGNFSLQYYSLLIIRLYTDFQLNLYPGTGRKICGGGWWWW